MKNLSFTDIKAIQRILLVLIFIAGFWLSISPSAPPLVLLALSSTTLSFMVLIHRKTIMEAYEQQFQAGGGTNKLTAPSRWVYRFNIYVLWPIVLLFSLYALLVAFFK